MLPDFITVAMTIGQYDRWLLKVEQNVLESCVPFVTIITIS